MMADGTNDAELRLPAEFLDDDVFFGEKSGGGDCLFPADFPYEVGYDSNLSSPVESAAGTESSDEEDSMTGLTQQMALYFIQDDAKGSISAHAPYNPQDIMAAGSPQSTLCAVSSWKASRQENRDRPSLFSSPATTSLEPHKDGGWDLLYAAAERVMRMRLLEGAHDNQYCKMRQCGRGLFTPPHRKTPYPVDATAFQQNGTSPYTNLSLNAQHQLRVTQPFQQLNRQEMMRQVVPSTTWSRQGRVKGGGPDGGGFAGSKLIPRPPGHHAAALPPIQPVSCSGMRAVFLNPASRRESCGTGVFLPRRVDNPTEFRKKPACSTVLLPARVVQALNLNLDEIGALPGGAYATEHDGIVIRNKATAPQKRNYRHQLRPANLHRYHQQQQQQEPRLPSEWTY